MPHGALPPTSILAVDVTVLEDTVGFALLKETKMKDGADHVRGTGPLKPPEPVRLRVDDPTPPCGRLSDVGLAKILKSGGGLLTSQTCSSGPKIIPPAGFAQLPLAGYIRKFNICESVEPKSTSVEPEVDEEVVRV